MSIVADHFSHLKVHSASWSDGKDVLSRMNISYAHVPTCDPKLGLQHDALIQAG